MLMRALISRLNSGTDTHSSTVPSSHRRSVDFVYQQFPTLSGIILRLLGEKKPLNKEPEGWAQQRIETVFPALEILERYGVPLLHSELIKSRVKGYLGSPSWPLRDKAAKAFSSNIDQHDTLHTLRDILTFDIKFQNALHGRLLAARWLVRLQKIYLCEEKNGKLFRFRAISSSVDCSSAIFLTTFRHGV